MNILGKRSQGLIFIISGPAGAGKTTLARMSCEEFSCVVKSTTYTTRKARDYEKQGRDYHFVSEDLFKKMDLEGRFLETAKIYGNFYGTCFKDIENLQKKGKHVLLVVDVQGAESLKDKLNAIFIFVTVPNLQELKKRLKERGTESEKDLQVRIENAEKEIQAKAIFDYHLVNDELPIAYEALRSILIAEEHRI